MGRLTAPLPRRPAPVRPGSQAEDGVQRREMRATSCSVVRATVAYMASAPSPLSLRLGRDGLRALDEIARRRGLTRAEAARQAIAETAERERRRAGLAAEARALMKDRAYVREAREVAALMEQLSGTR